MKRNVGSLSTGSSRAAPQKLAEVLETCLADLEAGRGVDTARLIAAHPDIAADLRACLDTLEFVEEATGSLGLVRTSETPPVPGLLLGDYRIVREIGRGGMGVVYEAEQLSIGRRVALKVLPFAAVLDPRQLKRFKNEAQAAGQLHHTNIVPVFAVGCARGVHF